MNGDFTRKRQLTSDFPIASLCPESTGRYADTSVVEATGRSTRAGHLFVHVSSGDPTVDDWPLPQTYEAMDRQQKLRNANDGKQGSDAINGEYSNRTPKLKLSGFQHALRFAFQSMRLVRRHSQEDVTGPSRHILTTTTSASASQVPATSIALVNGTSLSIGPEKPRSVPLSDSSTTTTGCEHDEAEQVEATTSATSVTPERTMRDALHAGEQTNASESGQEAGSAGDAADTDTNASLISDSAAAVSLSSTHQQEDMTTRDAAVTVQEDQHLENGVERIACSNDRSPLKDDTSAADTPSDEDYPRTARACYALGVWKSFPCGKREELHPEWPSVTVHLFYLTRPHQPHPQSPTTTSQYSCDGGRDVQYVCRIHPSAPFAFLLQEIRSWEMASASFAGGDICCWSSVDIYCKIGAGLIRVTPDYSVSRFNVGKDQLQVLLNIF